MIKALDLWLPAWLGRERTSTGDGARHVMIAVCDHFEPCHGADRVEGRARIARWREGFPKLAAEFRDADGVEPKHTFFYPIEQYDADHAAGLAEICAATGCEVEVHLHHENDTPENLRRTLEQGVERLAGHGLLAREEDGARRYGFIHGNWALDDSHPRGRHCGVRGELAVLRETGCYADFTMPSAPDRTQTRLINSIYYARSTAGSKSHDRGRRVRAAAAPGAMRDELLMVQGPLALNWHRRKLGLLPRIENSDLTAANPPTAGRLRVWLECGITVAGRADWLFVKLHTHGAKPANAQMLLGEPMRAFHRALAAGDERLHFHYVTAREMVNIVLAAEAGHTGDPGRWRDFRYRRAGAPARAPNAAGARA